MVAFSNMKSQEESTWLDIDNDDLLDSLNTLYIDSRYPGDMGLLPYGQPTIEDAKEFYHFSQEIFDEVSKIIG